VLLFERGRGGVYIEQLLKSFERWLLGMSFQCMYSSAEMRDGKV